MAGILAFVAILDFVFLLIFQHGKNTYREKLAAQADAELNNRSFGRLLNNRFGNTGITIYSIIWFGLTIVHTAGKAHAQQQEQFLVVDHSPELVVLRAYDDYLVTSPFDRATKQVEKKLYILKIEEMDKTPLTLEKIGPLKIKE